MVGMRSDAIGLWDCGLKGDFSFPFRECANGLWLTALKLGEGRFQR